MRGTTWNFDSDTQLRPGEGAYIQVRYEQVQQEEGKGKGVEVRQTTTSTGLRG